MLQHLKTTGFSLIVMHMRTFFSSCLVQHIGRKNTEHFRFLLCPWTVPPDTLIHTHSTCNTLLLPNDKCQNRLNVPAHLSWPIYTFSGVYSEWINVSLDRVWGLRSGLHSTFLYWADPVPHKAPGQFGFLTESFSNLDLEAESHCGQNISGVRGLGAGSGTQAGGLNR